MVEFNYIIGISASEEIPEDIKFTYLNRSVNGNRILGLITMISRFLIDTIK